MIANISTLLNYCDCPEAIENYAAAISSPELYILHHKKGLYNHRESLLFEEQYYHVPVKELVFVPAYDHAIIHHICNKYEQRPLILGQIKRYDKMLDYETFIEFLKEFDKKITK